MGMMAGVVAGGEAEPGDGPIDRAAAPVPLDGVTAMRLPRVLELVLIQQSLPEPEKVRRIVCAGVRVGPSVPKFNCVRFRLICLTATLLWSTTIGVGA